MNFNQRGNPQFYTTGCSGFGCLIFLFLIISLIQGSLYFLFRYFGVIVLIGILIWIFRKWTSSDTRNKKSEKHTSTKSNNWNRDFEKTKDTAYHNVDRDFEEIDHTEEDFDDF